MVEIFIPCLPKVLPHPLDLALQVGHVVFDNMPDLLEIDAKIIVDHDVADMFNAAFKFFANRLNNRSQCRSAATWL